LGEVFLDEDDTSDAETMSMVVNTDPEAVDTEPEAVDTEPDNLGASHANRRRV
jgi:hypothetical protein